MGDLIPIALFLEELKSENVGRRANSVRHLSSIAVALGKERTRSELVPFLSELLDDEPQVLVALAEAIGDLVDLIGGAKYAELLLAPLQELLLVDVARSKALVSLRKVLRQVDAKLIGDFLGRLAAEKQAALRAAAALLLPLALHPTSEVLLRTLATDTDPSVRQAVSVLLKDIPLDVLPKEEFIDILVRSARDELEAVRKEVFEAWIKLGPHVPKEQIEKPLSEALALLGDSSAEVRRALCAALGTLATFLSPEALRIAIGGHLSSALGDASMRPILLTSLRKVSETWSGAVIGDLLRPVLSTLREDKAYRQRCAATDLFVFLCETTQGFYPVEAVPILRTILEDRAAIVRTSAVTAIESLARSLPGPEEHLLPLVIAQSTQPNYLLRIAAVNALFALLLSVSPSVRDNSILPTLIRLGADSVPNVQLAVLTTLRNRSGDLSSMRDLLLPHIKKLAVSSSDVDVINHVRGVLDTYKDV